MQPTYYVKHPDGTYSEADPQPVELRNDKPDNSNECKCLVWPLGPDYCPVHAA